MGDRELFERLQAKDPQAQRAFWKEKRPDLRALCASVLGRGPDADEVADAVLVDFLFDYVHRMQHPEAVATYVRLMAMRRSLRLKAKRDASESDAVLEGEIDPAKPDEAAHVALLRPRLADCLNRLTPKAQEVIRLRYSGDLTNEEIGRLVGGSKQYIGKLLKQSQALLRTCLGGAHA
jgi:RNA polymerase sigma factor (sigma-70 family)